MQRLPFRDDPAGRTPPPGSVEAYWPPLTPEHGFPSLPILLSRHGRRALPLRPSPFFRRAPNPAISPPAK